MQVAGLGRCATCYGRLWQAAHPDHVRTYRQRQRERTSDPRHWRLPETSDVRERFHQEHPGSARYWVGVSAIPAPLVSYDAWELNMLDVASWREIAAPAAPVGAFCVTRRGRELLAEAARTGSHGPPLRSFRLWHHYR